jgi:hypothetical protein
MDAFELLKADHRKVAELFDRLEAASGKAKLAVFKQINSELELHSHIEEKILYPALEKPQETHDLTLEAYEEHAVVKTLLTELSGARSPNDEWDAKAKVLRENVEHHVKEEENELFDKADDALSSEQIEALGEQMEAEKARKQGKPAPRRAAAKAAKSTKASAGKKGILSKLANFVGLGEGSAKKAAKKRPAKKKTAARGTSKASAKTTAKKAGKSARTSATKRSAAKASKGASAKRSSRSKAKAGASARKKSGTRKAAKK